MPTSRREENGIQAAFTKSGFRFINRMQFFYWIQILIYYVSKSRILIEYHLSFVLCFDVFLLGDIKYDTTWFIYVY